MTIIVQNQDIDASIAKGARGWEISFRDAAFVRCDMIMIDPHTRRFGGMLHEGYHDFGALPQEINLQDVRAGDDAILRGRHASGREFRLSAPITFFYNQQKGKAA